MPTPFMLPTQMGQLPTQTIHARFATRPALYSVVFNALRSRILERYPSLKLDLLAVKLATPLPSGEYTYPLLMEVAVAQVLNPQLLDLHSPRERPYFLTQQPPAVLQPQSPPLIDMQVIAQIIDELPSSLYLHWQHDLADYWSQLDNHGSSRWQWLGALLNGQMTAAAAGRTSLSETQRDMLTAVATWPALAERLPHSSPPTHVYFIESTLLKAGNEVRLLTPDMLLVCDKQVLLYSVAGVVETFDSIDAFGQAWGARMQEQFQFDSLTWRRNEPENNVFEQQAGLILNQQLEDLAAFRFQGQDERSLGLRLEQLTDPAVYFTPEPTTVPASLRTVSEQLPEWLMQADPADRFAYHRHLQDMAQVLRQNQGRSFNEGIEDIQRFSRTLLRTQMQTDHGALDPDDVLLDFAVAAGYPGGSGIIEHVRMSLTELAIRNLAGKPKGTLKLSLKSGAPLPDWMNENYLLGSTGLIQRVDIGARYPQNINDLLLSDSVDARRREQLFTRELKVHLPMQALEYKIRRLHGVTLKGYLYVKALMGEMPADRIVDDQEIVLRPLALCRKTGATPDEVNNVFIIEARDASVGPHLLYRPLYAPALLEYPTRQALLAAIAQPGAVQDSVLTWLSDKARPIYDHGGILEPHLIRFLPGDEFNIAEKPAPATLAVDEGAGEWLQSQINGQLLNHLFGSTARALVDLADRESVSNHESRWAILMEGAWLLFNTLLLPLARGPAMLAGWLLVLVSSVEQDLAGLDSADPTTRELALIDLLLNTATVLLHAASSPRRPKPTNEHNTLTSWRRRAGVPHHQDAPVIRHGAVALPGEPPAAGHTALDFSHSLASPQAGAKLLKALLDVHVPWPERLPTAEQSGTFKGLYRIDGTWHASVGGLLFQANVVPGFGEVYLVHPQHPEHPGFKLVSDNQGHWRLDRRARLEGGMPRERLSEWQRKRKARLEELNSGLEVLSTEASALAPQAQQLTDAVKRAQVQLTEHQQALRADWERLGSPSLLPELRPRIAERHAQRRTSTVRATNLWSIAVDHYQANMQAYISTQEKSLTMARELLDLDRTQIQYKQVRDIATDNIHSHLISTYSYLHQKIKNTLETGRGESLSELLLRVDRELPNHITDGYEEFISGATQRLEVLREMFNVAEKIEVILQQAVPALRAQLTSKITSSNTVSSVVIEQHILLAFVELIVDRARDTDNPRERPFLMVLTDRRATTSILTHTEILATSGYSPAEQIDILKEALQQYGRLENAVNSLSEMGSELVREHYRTSFLEQFSVARTALEAQLAQLILSEEGFIPRRAPNRDARQKPASRRVIRTRNRETLVGDLRPSEPGVGGSFVDIKNPFTGQTVATYHEHANEGFWNVVEQAPPAQPPAAPAVRTLRAIKAHAQIIKDERAGIDASIRFQQRKLQEPGRREGVDPYEWDVMLSQHAAKFEALAAELKRDHSADGQADALHDAYLDQARAAMQQAREVCGEGYKLQRPKAANAAYLWRHGFIDINLLRSRIKLGEHDFLTEYAIRDKKKIEAGKQGEDNVLWYAHFHYPAADTPALQPAFGHLKTVADRKFTRKQLIEKARADNRAVVNLEKAEIRAPLDQELFLGLEVL
ncbi:hypothetical protein C4K03_2838 [Pseudomonas synxantha]|uniref:Dermonecrotic toxin N-terminal domain-containing protein n=1 Tax=Pseudomonas synxantha TaxID=47883 RepID=A0A3G7U6J9_9PSED|nr:hypothetical protein [Pseudomonas synxantha]AZE54993.1 hypothetical protein C4K03_2838 [Pseudomonas synxantha]